MAARDRFGTGAPSSSGSQLLRFIQSACDPVNYEPNLALNFQISDLINQKKGNAPREAAVAIVNLINHRNPNVSMLALSLLDICVKNCGYPFHLQISTKDFLNELVRRFPERPPPRPTRVQQRILQLIEEWRGTICHTSKYKDDLGFIRDMHRLLSYKGYVFPQVRREDVAVLNPAETLKSAEEMEAEERAAQQAKLQELIRRGTPQDLAEANHLMKVLVGYDQESKTDYRAKAAEEVGKLKHKCRLLEEMLVGIEKGDKVGEQDVFEFLADSLKKAQPKIRKIIEEESDDTEAVNKLLELNDNINSVLERYNLIKKGDIDGAKKLPTVTGGSSPAPGGKAAAPKQEVSLIDLGGDDDLLGGGSSDKATQKKPAGNSLEDDLLGLSLDSGPTSFGEGGGIALGFGANFNVPGPPLLSSTIQSNVAGQTRPISQANSRSTTPNYAAFGTPPAQPDYSNAFSNLAPLKQIQQRPASGSSNQGLSGSSSLFGGLDSIMPSSQPVSKPQNTTQHQKNGSDDDWNFVAAVPTQESLPTSTLTLLDGKLKVVIGIGRPEPVGPIIVEAVFSNNTSQLIHDLTFSMAVMKHLSLKMESQSGRALQPHQQNGITQTIMISGVGLGQGSTVKVRWKASYKVGITGGLSEEIGTIESLPIA